MLSAEAAEADADASSSEWQANEADAGAAEQIPESDIGYTLSSFMDYNENFVNLINPWRSTQKDIKAVTQTQKRFQGSPGS